MSDDGRDGRRAAVELVRARMTGALSTENGARLEQLDVMVLLDLTVELAFLAGGFDRERTTALLDRLLGSAGAGSA